MIFDILTLSKGTRGRAKKYAVANPIYVSNSHTKFGWISSNSLRVDRDNKHCILFMTHRQTMQIQIIRHRTCLIMISTVS